MNPERNRQIRSKSAGVVEFYLSSLQRSESHRQARIVSRKYEDLKEEVEFKSVAEKAQLLKAHIDERSGTKRRTDHIAHSEIGDRLCEGISSDVAKLYLAKILRNKQEEVEEKGRPTSCENEYWEIRQACSGISRETVGFYLSILYGSKANTNKCTRPSRKTHRD